MGVKPAASKAGSCASEDAVGTGHAGEGPAPYQPLCPFLLCLLQRDDIDLCQGSWIQTDELGGHLDATQKDRDG